MRIIRYFLFALVCSAHVFGSVVRTPVDVAARVNSVFSCNFEEIAKSVVCDEKVFEEFLHQYSPATVMSWRFHGSDFIKALCDAVETKSGQQKIAAWLKPYIQQLFAAVSLDSVLTVGSSSTNHVVFDPSTSQVLQYDLLCHFKGNIKRIAPLLCSIVLDEKRLNDAGYFVFYHGQRWEYLLGERLYTDLWALTQAKARPENYIFPHVRVAGLNPLLYDEWLNRKTILKEGVPAITDGFGARDVLLFTTHALFGNYRKCQTSSAFSFFLSNDNMGSICFSLRDIFKHYSLNSLYKKYKKQLDTLQKLHEKAQTFGTILRIAIPKNMVRDYVFRTRLGMVFEGDVYTFLDDIEKAPHKQLYDEAFCIVMLDKAMDPEGGFLIKPYHCADTAQYKKFETEYEKLICAIAADINA